MKILSLLFIIGTILFATDAKEELELVNCIIEDVSDPQTKQTMTIWQEGRFGLRPYRENYLLPYGYQKNKYKSYLPTDEYKNYEAELQVSLKLNIGNNLLGLSEKYYMSYTHTAFWQIYAQSSPFRETNYNPEAFVIFPVSDRKTFIHLRSIKLALAHRSNGVGDNKDFVYPEEYFYLENRSRSLNYLYTTITVQHASLITELTLWGRIPESKSDDDNRYMMDYTGYSSIDFKYFKGKHIFTLMGRANFATGYGAVELTYSHPAFVDDVYFYGKIFSGYGESLIDYDNHITKFSVGFSFSR